METGRWSDCTMTGRRGRIKDEGNERGGGKESYWAILIFQFSLPASLPPSLPLLSFHLHHSSLHPFPIPPSTLTPGWYMIDAAFFSPHLLLSLSFSLLPPPQLQHPSSAFLFIPPFFQSVLWFVEGLMFPIRPQSPTSHLAQRRRMTRCALTLQHMTPSFMSPLIITLPSKQT